MAEITPVGAAAILPYYTSAASAGGGANQVLVQNEASRTQVNREIAALSGAAQELQRSLAVFSDTGLISKFFKNEITSDGFRTLACDSIKKLVNAYNGFNEAVKSSKCITGEGAKLPEKIRALLAGKDAADFCRLGIEIDKQTGKLKFDDKKFLALFDEDYKTAKKLLIGDKYLAPQLDDMVKTVLNRSAGYYFSTPFVISI